MKIVRIIEKIKIACEDIENRDGIITPQALVEEARPISSPIHNQFNWDDEEAAEQYRLWQARELIKKVTITFEKRKVFGFHNVKVNIDNTLTQGYVSSVRIMSNQDLRNQVIQQALKQLLYWQDQYKTYTELDALINKPSLKGLIKRYIKN